MHLRLYFQEHLTELVRLVGYDGVAADRCRELLQPLIVRFGKAKMMEACEEIIEMDATKQPPVARLKSDVRKLSFQLLGPPPESRTTQTSAASSTKEGKANQGGKPVSMPRYHVMAKFEEYLAAAKETFVTGKELRRQHPALQMLPAVDYLVHRGAMRLIVAVRPSFRGNQAAQLIAYQDAVLANHAAVRIWPTEGPSDWEWQEHELLADALGIDTKRFKLSLDDWKAVFEHREGDRKCGRDWQSEGCACAACRAARSILATSVSKRRSRH